MALALEGLRVVDADTHLTERHDLWTSRAPAALRDRVPHVKEVEGVESWVVGDTVMGFASGGGVVDPRGRKGRPLEALYEWTIDQIHPAAYDPSARLELMDEAGIWAQVLFPNNVGLGGEGLAQAIPDAALRLACLQIYNDYTAQVQADSGDRLLPLGVLPAWDVQASVREAQRVERMGLRGVNMTCDPQDLGGPDLADRAWDPLWEVCSEALLPVHFHIGASVTTMTYFGTYPWPSQDEDTKLALGGSLLFIGNARVVANIIVSGILDRFPSLKFVSVESGIGWVPFILEALDYEMAENAPRQLERLSMRPSEYFRRQIYATYWFEQGHDRIADLVATVGEDNVLFETDFPHPTCLYPDPLQTIEDKIRPLRPEVQRKVLGENAARLYRI